MLEDVFVSKKDKSTRIDLQFSGDVSYAMEYSPQNNDITLSLKSIAEENLKATFPPVTVFSSVKTVSANDGVHIKLTLASGIKPEGPLSSSSGVSSRVRLVFVEDNVSASETRDGRLITSRQKWLGEGLEYVMYRFQPSALTGTDVHVLRYDLASPEFEMGLKLAKDTILGKARLSEMVETPRHIAAINASFFSGSGEPLGLLSSKGKLLSVPLFKRSAFGIFNGERALLGNPGFSGKVVTGKSEFSLEGINQSGNGAKGKILVYTPEYGPTTKTSGSGLELAIADGRIAAVQENDTPVPPQGFVVGVRGEPAPEMSETKFWDKVKFKWGLTPPWDVADFAVSGGPMLLDEGEEHITWKEEHFSKAFCTTAAPRTAIGIGSDSEVYLVVADGRDEKRNRGLSLSELAKIMKRIGCKSAVNLDGGGSTTMWIDGKVVNRPSDGSERRISSAIVLSRQSQSMYASVPSNTFGVM